MVGFDNSTSLHEIQSAAARDPPSNIPHTPSGVNPIAQGISAFLRDTAQLGDLRAESLRSENRIDSAIQ
jgi:hypothetical protein